MKKILLSLITVIMLVFPAFAEISSSSEAASSSSVYIRNVCDSLKWHSEAVKLRLDSIIVSDWEGLLTEKDAATKSQTVVRDYADINFGYLTPNSIPLSLNPQCIDADDTLIKAVWENNRWIKDSVQVTSRLVDVNETALTGFENAYNWVAFTQGSWPSDLSFSASEMLVSNTFDVHAAVYHAYSIYYDTTETITATETTKKIQYYRSSIITLDSASAFDGVATNVPSGKIATIKVLRIVLSDTNKIVSDPITRVAERISLPVKHFSVEAFQSGFIIRGPSGEVPELRRMDGSRIDATSAVRPGLYFARAPGISWQKIVAK
ncbi:MAG: hypothetical protein M0P13_08865 [Fibrobacteraceae bacterium]|nr:hypothetical protein [Fibrobacteraceae bacterium]